MTSWIRQFGNFLGISESSSSRSRSRTQIQFDENDPSSSLGNQSHHHSHRFSSSSPPPLFELFFLPNEPKIGILRVNYFELVKLERTLMEAASPSPSPQVGSIDNNNNNKNTSSTSSPSRTPNVKVKLVVQELLNQTVQEAISKASLISSRSQGESKNKKIIIDCVANCLAASLTANTNNNSSSNILSPENGIFFEIFGTSLIAAPSCDDSFESIKWLTMMSAMIHQHHQTALANDAAAAKINHHHHQSKDKENHQEEQVDEQEGEEEEEDHRIILATYTESPFHDDIVDYSLLILSAYFLFDGRLGWSETSEAVFDSVMRAANKTIKSFSQHQQPQREQQQKSSSSSSSAAAALSTSLFNYPVRPSCRRYHSHLHLLNRFRLLFVMPAFPVLPSCSSSASLSSSASASSSSLLFIEKINIQFAHNALSSMMSMMVASSSNGQQQLQDLEEEVSPFSFSISSFFLSIQNFGRRRKEEKNGVDLGSFYELDEVTNASPSSSSSFSLVFKLKKEKQDNDLAKVILSGDCVLSLYYRYHHHNENIDENTGHMLILSTVFSTFFANEPILRVRPVDFDTHPSRNAWPYADQQFALEEIHRQKQQQVQNVNNNDNMIRSDNDDNINDDNINDESSSPNPKKPQGRSEPLHHRQQQQPRVATLHHLSFPQPPPALQFLQAASMIVEFKKFEGNRKKEEEEERESSSTSTSNSSDFLFKHDKEEMNTILDTVRRSPLQKILSENNYQLITHQKEEEALSPTKKRRLQIEKNQTENDHYLDDDDFSDNDNDDEMNMGNSRRSRSHRRSINASRSRQDFSITNDDFFFLGIPVFGNENEQRQAKIENSSSSLASSKETKIKEKIINRLKKKRASVVADFVQARRYAEPQLAVALDEFAQLNNLKKLSNRFTRRGVAQAAVETEEDLLAMIRLEYDQRRAQMEEQEQEVEEAPETEKEVQPKKIEKAVHVDPGSDNVEVKAKKEEPQQQPEQQQQQHKIQEVSTTTTAATSRPAPPANPMLAELLARTQNRANTAVTTSTSAPAVVQPKPTTTIGGGAGGGMAGIFAELKAKTGGNNTTTTTTTTKQESPSPATVTTTTDASGKFRPPRKGPPPRHDGKMPPCPMRDYFPENYTGKGANNSVPPTAATSSGSNNGNPLAAAAAAIAAMKNKQQQAAGVGLPQQKPKEVGPKMKTFFWKKLKIKNKVGVWMDSNESDDGDDKDKEKQKQNSSSSSSLLDSTQEEFLKNLFLQKPPEKKVTTTTNQSNNNSASSHLKKKKSTALTGQRQQAVGIVLKKLKLTPESFCRKLLECSPDLVDPDTIDAVYRCMPLPDEVKNLKFESEKRDQIEWGDAEEALFAISQKVPDAKERLALVKSINDVEGMLETTERQFGAISSVVPKLVVLSSKSGGEEHNKAAAATENNSSSSSSSSSPASSLAKVLKLILKVGNFLNKGTVHGNAVGFSLETLSTMTMMKSVDGKSTLMDVVVEMFYSSPCNMNDLHQPPPKEDFADDLLKSITNASSIPLSQLSLNVAELARTMQRTRKASTITTTKSKTSSSSDQQKEKEEQLEGGGEDKLHLVARQAQEQYSTRIASLLIKEQNVREELISMIEYFGEGQNLLTSTSTTSGNNSKSSSSSSQQAIDEVTLFTCLRSFCRDWIRCRSSFAEKQVKKMKLLKQQLANTSIDNRNEEASEKRRDESSMASSTFQDHGALLKKVQEKRKQEEEGDW